MRQSKGVPPQAGSGCQPTASAASSTASSQSGIPNAIIAVQRFIEERSGVQCRVDDTHTNNWKSLTFTGHRASAYMWADDTASALVPVLEALADAEFSLPGQIIADVMFHEPKDVPTWGGCSFVIDVLMVDDDSASGTLTEGGDAEQAPGESLSGPTGEAGDAHA